MNSKSFKKLTILELKLIIII